MKKFLSQHGHQRFLFNVYKRFFIFVAFFTFFNVFLFFITFFYIYGVILHVSSAAYRCNLCGCRNGALACADSERSIAAETRKSNVAAAGGGAWWVTDSKQ